MTDYSDTALTFCKDVLGWDDAYFIWNCVHTEKMYFRYTELADVLGAVRTWLRKNSLRMKIELPDAPVEVWQDTGSVTRKLAEATHENLGAAAMAACIEANRELKGEA